MNVTTKKKDGDDGDTPMSDEYVDVDNDFDDEYEYEEESISHNPELVLNFLRRMSVASELLTKTKCSTTSKRADDYLDEDQKKKKNSSNMAKMDVDDDEKNQEKEEENHNNKSARDYINIIARNLLKSCNPIILSGGIDNLPKLNNNNQYNTADHGVLHDDNNEEEKPILFVKPYKWRRTDYLRQLLRILASSSMDVAAQVCSIAIQKTLSSTTSSSPNVDREEEEEEKKSYMAIEPFILFSYWLPLAPHLGPMVNDLLQSLKVPFETIFTTTTTTTKALQNQKFVFIIAEACYNICSFYSSEYGSIDTVHQFCDWSFLFNLISHHHHQQQPQQQHLKQDEDIEMTDPDEDTTHQQQQHVDEDHSYFSYETAIRWYSVRCMGKLLDWKTAVLNSVLEKDGLQSNHVPWRPHPWTIDQEETDIQFAMFSGRASLWNNNSEEEVPLPSAMQIQMNLIPPSPILTRIANGICFYKDGSITNANPRSEDGTTDGSTNVNTSHDGLRQGQARKLIQTPTVCRNLSLLSAALCQHNNPMPVLICGPQGSGKSSLVRELLRLCRPKESLLEFHIDEETDSKTLVGSYTTTDIPGEFAWRPGPLTHATREGRWVLLEDVDSVPVEIQAALVKLLKDRTLPLGNGKYERCHPNFRLFGTCSTTTMPGMMNQRQRQQQHRRHQRRNLRIASNKGGGKRVFNPTLWRKVHVKPLPYSELKQVAMSLHPNIPSAVVESAVCLFQSTDRSGRELGSQPHTTLDNYDNNQAGDSVEELPQVQLISFGGRDPSVRDLFKLLSRISNTVNFEPSATYATEAQRTLCMAESVDIFIGASPHQQMKSDFVRLTAARTWNISQDLADTYIKTRRPSITIGIDFVDIGRARIYTGPEAEFSRSTQHSSGVFAQTNHALRLMESVGVCLRENEPVLLVGETGCGKTSLIQQLATICERDLIVQNLSLQTDSTDLLGGYKPLDLKTVARKIYGEFVDIFVSTFSRKQNLKFLKYASSMLEKSNWKKLSQCFQRAADLGTAKMADRTMAERKTKTGPTAESWNKFSKASERFERQRLSCDAGLAFTFSEGVLVDAIVHGKWVLLDEINLASSETLQRLCGLLDDPSGSVTLTERGDAAAIVRHPDFRLFAAMNPATDAGKKDLPPSIRSRFSEIYVDELLDPLELRIVASRYLETILPNDGQPPENSDLVISAVDVYLKCRVLAEKALVDGAGHKPRYTLRTLSRALSAAKQLILQQRLPRRRAIFEGFQLAFEGSLDTASIKAVRKLLKSVLPDDVKKSDLEHPGKRPKGKADTETYTLVKPFWIKAGPNEPVDWSDTSSIGKPRFILTPSIASSLRRLSRALAAGDWPVLLEGPTSAGKTTLVEYIAARSGHRVVRINNHEHTDIQEYTGSFAADSSGSLSFRDGLLVRALRFGYWVILDELNLAPSEVLEALNRLLDDNRELFIAETNETVKPHKSFRLFATQNPCGAYGGRKPLSRAFRNRFVEIHMGDIPNFEMKTILEQKCGCPPSHAKYLVDIMISLRHKRSKSNLFLGKDSFITPRDLLRWAERKGSTKQEVAEQGYMLLAERLRSQEERDFVQDVLEETLKVSLRMEEYYFGTHAEARKLLSDAMESLEFDEADFLSSVAPTTSLLRLITLVLACIKQKEPVLLVGDTGCGKTTVVQFLSSILKKKLHIVNCHATTETSDLLGGLRPVRGRQAIAHRILEKVRILLSSWPNQNLFEEIQFPRVLDKDKPRENMPIDENEKLDATDVSELLCLTRAIYKARPRREETMSGEREIKRRKLTPEGQHECSDGEVDDSSFKTLVEEIEGLGRQYTALFEWSDGPLVYAMKAGEMLLLDEMSLAEDAVLERLNSVLEPSRTIVLAEKGEVGPSGSEIGTSVIVAEDGFRIFATMNPGGDFGKRELSPALRSRFTEIWVPPVSHRADFELVLSRTLLPRDPQEKSLTSAVLTCMLNYVNWFNNNICGDPSRPFSGHSLTLRDIISWARFIVEARAANENLAMWEAYCHGACLMHLDGLGLGSGLAQEDASGARKSAEGFLMGQVPQGISVSNLRGAEEKLAVHATGKFGASPFFIRTGKLQINGMNFNLEASTTAQNMFRVLRAMQVRKPVLLEGSPGVGKTSLISALAAATGHKLVRINLSEQTDISDLMGSDLPMQNSTASGASFEWCDGVLLTAIKEGSWVLLDELNLASQSVLEGLNSCLDHRAEVFIPELGRTFSCPQSFRVFAAQNPLAQGGGRKGLPRSFLNRFTKVFVTSLSERDLRDIVGSRFPTLDKTLINRMIEFNNEVYSDVVVRHEYGFEGSPWEFNLRDVFRWCELVSSGHSSFETLARDLYYQRFRTLPDRDKVDMTFEKYFGKNMKSAPTSNIRLLESCVEVGDSVLQRQALLHGGPSNPLWQDSLMSLSRQMPTEAVARCVARNWPCLLVGPAGSGKTSIVTSLAELCNTKLVIQCLSPSSDVTELVGCFEQVDSTAGERQCLENLCMHAEEFLMSNSLDSIDTSKVWSLLLTLKTFISNQVEAADPFSGVFQPSSNVHSAAFELSQVLLHAEYEGCKAISPSKRHRLDEIISRLEGCNKGRDRKDDGNETHFIWRDGPLVEAMEMGFWLLLDNVNLCPSSVLDRLNSVMEADGELLLSECGQVGGSYGESSHRRIRPHKDFRIFLSMDSVNGEVSRAMRNRCVEVSILDSISPKANEASETMVPHAVTMTNDEKIDCFGILQHGGIRSTELATLILSIHSDEKRESPSIGAEPPCLSEVIKSASIFRGLTLKGISGGVALRHFLQLSFQVEEETVLQLLAQDQFKSLRIAPWIALPQSSPIRSSCGAISPLKSVPWEARLLRIFSSSQSKVFPVLICPELGLLETATSSVQELGQFACHDSDLRDALAQLYLASATPADFFSRCNHFDGLESATSFTVGWMASFLKNKLILPDRQVQRSGEDSSPDLPSLGITWFSFPAEIRRLQSDRLCQRLREWRWLRVVSSKHSAPDVLEEMSVLEASFYMNESLLGHSSVSCPVLPSLYPFFACVDRFIYLALCDIAAQEEIKVKSGSLQQFSLFMDERDLLWCHLEEGLLCPRHGCAFAFEVSGFIVQWKRLRKCLVKLLPRFAGSVFRDDTKIQMAKLEKIMDAIDRAVFGSRLTMSTKTLRKRMIQPRLPNASEYWEMIFQIRALSERCTILSEQAFNPFANAEASVSVQSLVDSYHPILYTSLEDRLQLLTALCTIYWSWTDELNSAGSEENAFVSDLNFGTKMNELYNQKRRTFVTEVARAKIDVSISTVENQLSAESLEGLQEQSQASVASSNAYSRLGESLLSCFFRIQMSALTEFWCAIEETRICSAICSMLQDGSDPINLHSKLLFLLPSIKRLINTVLAGTVWSVVDMRPFQTLVWVLEGSPEENYNSRELLRCLLPSILFSRSRHLFLNSFGNNNVVSEKLELPSTWIDDEVSSDKSLLVNQNPEGVCRHFGSQVLRMQLRSEFMLRLLGRQLSLSRNNASRVFTMENSAFRYKQYRDIVEALSCMPDFHSTEDSQLSITEFLLIDVLHALEATQFAAEIQRIRECLTSSNSSDIMGTKHLKFDDRVQTDPQLHRLMTDLVKPMIESYVEALNAKKGSKERKQQSALASIYAGLVRLRIMKPDSPLDPGKEPLAKVSLINRKLTGAKIRIMAIRFNRGFIHGDFSAASSDCRPLLDDAIAMVDKCRALKKKVVHRVPGAPLFSEFFRETNDFIETAARSETVLNLARNIKTADDRAAVLGWQRTAGAFCQRLSNEYEAFEEFVGPLLTSVQMIQDGLNLLAESSLDCCDDVILRFFGQLVELPFRNNSEFVKCSTRTLSYIAHQASILDDRKRTNCQIAVSLALLSRISLKQLGSGLRSPDVVACCKVIDTLVRSHLKTGDRQRGERLEDDDERVYREQFPDHRKDFNELLEVDDDDDEQSIAETSIPDDDNSTFNGLLSDRQIELLCSFHDRIFSTKIGHVSDSSSMLAFHCAYGAAFELENTFGCLKDLSVDTETLGGHVFAMSLTIAPTTGSSRVYPHLPSHSGVLDFHNDPMPSEAKLAEVPVGKLMARVTQLLTAFPGHSILLGIGRVCERVRKFDLMTTPIGKVMTGMEVVLKHAQSWEQHASEKVRLGTALEAVGQLVTRWRKVELESWPSLLQARQTRHLHKARKHWMRLHQVLFDNAVEKLGEETAEEVSILQLDGFQTSSPAWVWKGIASPRGDILPLSDKESDEQLSELVKTIDTFILTSSLGEFEERQRILHSFSIQLLLVANLSGTSSSWRLRQARVLHSIWSYYSQFSRFLSTKLESLRKPIEKELVDEVKLAKWDEQSYYALAESTERNHRKLMRILTKYDECLELNAGSLIQEENFRGIRSDANSSEDVSSNVPSDSTIFPLVNSKFETNWRQRASSLLVDQSNDLNKTTWADSEQIDVSVGRDHIGKIEKYAKKMFSMTRKGTALSHSWAEIGTELTSSICAAIFDRLGSLRKKSTRPMKERALVDLFRELKKNGFTTTKWAVPAEAKRMEQVFQLPPPNLSGIHIGGKVEPIFAKAEEYFLRCLVEIHSFRSEVKMHGSRHMTTRQIELMLNLGNSGVFMLSQQRCMLSHIIGDIRSLQDCTTSMSFENASLPAPQSFLRQAMRLFTQEANSAVESIRELLMFMKVSQGLLKKDKLNWARDAITRLESLLFTPSSTDSRDGELEVVDWKKLDAVANDCKKLQDAEKVVRECYNSCRNFDCLPSDIFDIPIAKISKAIKLGANCKVNVGIHESSNVPLPSLDPFVSDLSTAIERSLISFQGFSVEASGPPCEGSGDSGSVVESEETAIRDCHRKLSTAWNRIDLGMLVAAMKKVLRRTCDQVVDSGRIAEHERECCLRLVSNANILSRHVLSLAETLLKDTVEFFALSAKLNYILLRLYRVLVAKGFCSDEVAEDDGDAEGDISGMTFEDDQEGTGMGEGEGKTDVTEQLESEEQLLGLKSDNDNGDTEADRESKKLNEEEAEQGMEMENDFDGETFDLPEKQDDKDDDENDDEGEELDRQIGEGPSPDEQVVDEKMWNESDDEDGIDEEEEKFEKDTNVGGETMEGATHTKDDDNENEKPSEETSEKPTDSTKEDGKDDGGEAENDTQEMTNDDDDDQYEESHGVDVRNETQEETQNDDENNDEFDLEDEMRLDDEDGEEEGTNDNENHADHQDEMDDSKSIEGEVEGETDPQSMPDDDNDDQDETDDAQQMPVSEATMEPNVDEEGEEDMNETPTNEEHVKNSDHQSAVEDAHGIQGNEGIDSVMEDAQEDENDKQGEDAEAGTTGGNSRGKASDSGGDGGDGYSERNESNEQIGEAETKDKDIDIPNPFRDPGDASKFWHRKLNVIQAAEDDQSEAVDVQEEQEISQEDDSGEFQFSSSDQRGTSQVLAETNEEEAADLDPQNQMDTQEKDSQKTDKKSKKPEANKDDSAKSNVSMKKKKATKNPEKNTEKDETGSDGGEHDSDAASDNTNENDNFSEAQENDDPEPRSATNMVMSDMSKLNVGVDESDMALSTGVIQDEQVSGISSAEAEEARSHWLRIQAETHSLSRRLCEKLRLVMEPLVASKLRGDYRSGKRINMKRVISYIASGYRKDKIWLRRTKPAKRNYRVLLAVDDSESMRKSGAGKVALRAMATLAVGMNQLEIGEVGVASFGDDMKLLHPFHLPFTSEAGANMVMNCRFDQPRTRIALCVESAIASLESYGDSSSMQLVFLISDGRIERDSRATVKRLVREMVERNILLAMIIVEGQNKKKDSIVNMKEVSFEKGKPVVKQFIDDYPFPYYIILDDLTTLPEVMGDALRQWFEMLAQLKQN